jgi:predicted 3-demethylubiquinone-9 3-methyltransferase (glyoxalase superfamily)
MVRENAWFKKGVLGKMGVNRCRVQLAMPGWRSSIGNQIWLRARCIDRQSARALREYRRRLLARPSYTRTADEARPTTLSFLFARPIANEEQPKIYRKEMMEVSTKQKIYPCLWFDGNAEEAARFYTSVFPDSRIDHVWRSSIEYPGGKVDDVLLVEFTLAGLSYQALNGGPHDKFNDAISLSVSCNDQAEVDRLWDALTADGGKPVQCGWLKDKYGVSWQIVPEELVVMMRDKDSNKAKRVMEAMMQMVKLEVAGLRKAYEGMV